MRTFFQIVRAAVRRLWRCRHVDGDGASLMYRERRPLAGATSARPSKVMHLVCDRCGHARPAVDRTAGEHRRVVAIGAAAGRLHPRRARSMTAAEVVNLDARRRQAPRRGGGGPA